MLSTRSAYDSGVTAGSVLTGRVPHSAREAQVPLIDCSHVARGSLGARPSGKPLHVRAFPAQKGDTIFRGGDPAYSPHLDRESGADAEGAFVDRHTERYLRSTTSRSAQPCWPRCAGVAALEGEVAERGDQCVGDRGGCAVEAGH